MDAKRFEELCKDGEKADRLLQCGQTRESLKAYQALMEKIEATGELDSYLMAKLTLGTLRAYVKLGDFKSACDVWNADLDSSPYGVGIYALESAQTTVNDMVTYDMLCAFLHTLIDNSPEESAQAVNQYMSRVCEHAIDEGDRKMMRLTLNNWKQHLRTIFSTSIPHAYAASLIRFEKIYGEPVKPEPIDFPLSSVWERPSGFREMSRVVQLKDAHSILSRAKKRQAS